MFRFLFLSLFSCVSYFMYVQSVFAADVLSIQRQRVLSSNQTTFIAGHSTGLLDGMKPHALDLDNDGSPEYIFSEAGRIYIEHSNGTVLFEHDEGGTSKGWKDAGAKLFFVAPGKPFIAHYGVGTWGIDRVVIRSLFNGQLHVNGPQYTIGQIVDSVSIAQDPGGQSPIKGDASIPLGTEGALWFSGNVNAKPGRIDVEISPLGHLTASLRYQVNQSDGTNFGNGLTQAELCNSQGCKEFLLGTKVYDFESGAVAGSWVDTVPDLQHYPFLGVFFDYGSRHVDSSVLIPFEDPVGGDRYMLVAMHDTGRPVFAEVTLDSLYPAQVTITPLATDTSDQECGAGGVGAESLGVFAAIDGFSPDPAGFIVIGCKVFSASHVWLDGHSGIRDVSSIIPDLPDGFYFDIIRASVPKELMKGDLVCRLDYCVKGVSDQGIASTLQQVVPEVKSVSGSGRFLGTRLSSYQEPYGATGQFVNYRTGGTHGGVPRTLGAGYFFEDNVHNGTTTLHFNLTTVNHPNAFTTWKFDAPSGFVLPLSKKHEASLIALQHIQQGSVFRGNNSLSLHKGLRRLTEPLLPESVSSGQVFGLPYTCSGMNSAPAIQGPGHVVTGVNHRVVLSGFPAYTPVMLAVSNQNVNPGVPIANIVGYLNMWHQHSWVDSRVTDETGTVVFDYIPSYTVPGMPILLQGIAYCPGYAEFQTTPALYAVSQ